MAIKVFDDFTGAEVEEGEVYYELRFALFNSTGDQIGQGRFYYMKSDTMQTVMSNLQDFMQNPMKPPK